MKRYCAVVLVIGIVSQLSLFGMDKPFPFDRLEPELQKVVMILIDDLSYIGQTSKSWYAEVKKQQLDHIVDMHRLQDPRLARSNIPPFVFFAYPLDGDDRRDGKCAVDPNSRIFYKDSTKEKYPLECGAYHDTFHIDFSLADKYQRVEPTNLLIACITQNECEAKRLLKFYPLAQQHIIAGDSQSEKLSKDPETRQLFLAALCASKMIPNNKATSILLEYLEKANLSESSLVIKFARQREEREQEAANKRKFETFVLSMMPAFMVQPEIEEGYRRAKAEMEELAKNVFQPFSEEEEKKARKEFEDMILSTTGLPANPQAQAENTSEEISAGELEKLMLFFEAFPKK